MTMIDSLTISGISLRVDGAWGIKDTSPLLDMAVRGEDILIPGIDGVVPQVRRLDILVVSLGLMIFGQKNVNGTPYSDQRLGVYTNLHYLNENVVKPTATGDGTRPVVFTVTGLGVFEADAHVLPPLDHGSITNGYMRGILRLSFHEGRMTKTS